MRDSRLSMRLALHFPLLVVAVIAFGSCKPKIGDTCTGAAEACADEHTKLACKHDRLMPVQCDGPKGCKVDGTKARCDFSGNKPGSACDDSVVGLRMCHDAKSALGCQNGKFALVQCGGPGGCTPAGPEADALVKDCDTSVAKAGDDCDRAYTTKPACDADGKTTLECGKDNKFSFFRYCRGPKGCTSKNGDVQCDNSVSLAGDPCTPPVTEVCSADGAAILLCDGQKMFEKICVGPNRCKMGPDGTACDMLSPYEGSPCSNKGQRACQKPYEKDPAKLLECDGKKFTISKRCTGLCVFTRPSTFECK
jgi:hypothetical protein